MDPNRELRQALAPIAAYFDAVGLACDYAALAASRERGHLAVCLQALQTFDPGQVRIAGQAAFWINVYNAAVLRDAPELEMTLGGGGREVAAFFERPRLWIFRHEYSLDDIYHGVLRGNAPAPGRLRAPMRRDDPRLAHGPIALDERMHFALFRGARSSPAFRVLESGRLDVQLEEAATWYVRRTARVAPGGRVIEVPELMRWFAIDFGGDDGVLEFVLQRLDEDSVEAVEQAGGRLKLRTVAFDWTLARR
jgi:hypothetical protein